MSGRWQSETKGSWTAISRVPNLKAICLFAKGDCWHGGGLFLTNREFWLNDVRLDSKSFDNYRQTLNMRDATLTVSPMAV